MTTVKELIDAEAGISTHKRTGFMAEACMDDAKMKQGLWQPQDTLPIVARMWAAKHPKLAMILIRIYLAVNGKREVTK